VNPLLAQLDRRLDRRGETVVLRSRTQAGSTGSYVDAALPAIVRALTVEQLIGSITQQNFFVIISPTHLFRAQWPGGQVPTAGAAGGLIDSSDPRIPSTSDALFVRGMQRAIQRVAPVFDSGECIRIELSVQG
jgi:hypothetical protein